MAETLGSNSKQNKEDRVSDLPDAILCHILSFLPTKDSVATSCLSTRWRHLWASVPNLDLKYFGSEVRPEKDERFRNFVDRVLLFRNIFSIDKFRLNLTSSPQLYGAVSSWISTVVVHGIRELVLCFNARDYFNIPEELFTCKTIEVLKLHYNIHVTVPELLHLPNLKILHLCIEDFLNEDSIMDIFYGCPVLEEFVMERSHDFYIYDDDDIADDMSLSICSSSLKRLRIDLNDECDECYDINLDAPNLEYLYIKSDIPGRDYNIGNLSSLVGAYICVEQMFNDNLLKGISSVQFLRFASWTLESLAGPDIITWPTFPNLTHLEAACTSSSYNVIPCLLESAPNLKVIVFNKINKAPEVEPKRISSQLECIEFRRFRCKKAELELLKYFLEHAVALKKVVFSSNSLDFETYHDFLEELHEFPRYSTVLEINFRETSSRRILNSRFYSSSSSSEDSSGEE